MDSLKRVLKSRQMTYGELARRLRLSEASVKRVFSQGTLTLGRLEAICTVLDVSIGEVARLASEHAPGSVEMLSMEQESALAADPDLLTCFYLLANGRSGRDVCKEMQATERSVRRWMVRLHALRLLELRSGLQARVRATSAITWRRDGPVRKLYEKRVREEFLRSSFLGSGEMLLFRSAELSEASQRVLERKLERLGAEFRDLAELDRSVPARAKRSVAVLLAARPWVFSMFEGLRSS